MYICRMNAKCARILIVDYEETLCECLRTYLEFEGYDVTTASSAEEALRLDLSSFNLLLLDIMMDGMSGLELADLLKRNPSTADIPVIFLTARDSVDDMVDGLRIGDDYIAKPYSIRNVIARIQAVLRRTMPKPGHGVVCDRASLVCTVDGVPVKLPRKEFEILALFVENPGRIFSREEILKKVWPEQVIVVDRSIDVHVTRIRGKIAPYGGNIITRSGYGYGWKQD